MDPNTPPAGTPPPATPPAGTPPAATPPAGGTPAVDPEIQKKLDDADKIRTEFETYKKQVDPVLETLWSDTELLNKATEVHNKRLGKTPTTPPPAPGTPPTPPSSDPDVRNSQINIISDSFEKKVGIDKLSGEDQKNMRGAVGNMIKEMLDPKGNKTISQVFEEVSLTKLPWYLERAYDLVSKDDRIKSAREEGRSEILSQYSEQNGIIGSMPGGSVPLDQVTLTPLEKTTAKKQGVSEEDYLKYKKKIIEGKNS